MITLARMVHWKTALHFVKGEKTMKINLSKTVAIFVALSSLAYAWSSSDRQLSTTRSERFCRYWAPPSLLQG